MADPTKNTFENASSLYLNLSVPNSTTLATTKTDFIIGYQGEQYAGKTSRGFEFVATGANTAVMDIHANDGATADDFDYRMIWTAAGATGAGQANLNCQGAGAVFYHPLRTNPVGADLPPAWFLDYGQTDMTAGVNAGTTITFNTTFVSAPKLLCTLFDKNGAGSGNQNALTFYVETITTTGATVRGLGDCGSDIAVMWQAIGGV